MWRFGGEEIVSPIFPTAVYQTSVTALLFSNYGKTASLNWHEGLSNSKTQGEELTRKLLGHC